MNRNVQIDDPRALLHALLRRDFGAFLRKAFPAVSGGADIAWNWHLEAIAWQLERVARRECRQLLVTMPPRNLKSIAISVAWVAWMLGHSPSLNFVCVSYSNDLSARHARDCLALMQMGWYRELFPATIIRRLATSDFETTAGGGRLATSVTGTLTGRGGDIIIIDDPIKPDEASSETTRTNVNNWFRTTLVSRPNDKTASAIVVVMQRLHQDDLAGMLLETGGWDSLSLPAIAIDDERIQVGRNRFHERRIGDLLHPEREPLEELERLRRDMGPLVFDAQYQQQPVPASGNIIQADWLRSYDAGFDPISHAGYIIQSWDTASKDGLLNDWSVCVTAKVHRGTVWIIDVFRAKLTFPQLTEKAVELARLYRASTILIEDAASGTQLIQTLRAEKPTGVVGPVARQPEGDKQSRMMGVSGQIAGGQVLLPTDKHWLGSFTAELLGFPHARHDDQADALTQLMIWVRQIEVRAESTSSVGPIVIEYDSDGNTVNISGDYDGIFSKRYFPTDPNDTGW